MKYKAVMFDIDGTLTELGQRGIPDFLEKRLNKLIEQGVSVAVCSGRHHPEAIVKRLSNISPEKWILVAENGAVGFIFKNEEWTEFYRVPWPSDTIPRNELAEILQARMKFSKFFNNPSTIIFRPDAPIPASIDELAKKCNQYQNELERIFAELNIRGLHINNSKIGIIISPADGDKDRGILEFARYLGIADTKKIVCIGDQPDPGCNDFYFLNGKYGTPFAVNGPKQTLEIINKFFTI